jgi:hypothetical protein
MSIQLVEQGVQRLAVPVGGAAKGTALTRILAMRGSPGWLVKDGTIRDWSFEGITERDGVALLYGSFLDGAPLSASLAEPLAEVLPLLARVARGLALLAERGVRPFAIQTDAVILGSSGEVLFLPPEICREIRDLRTFEANRETFEAINHPDLRGLSMASFTLASILYRSVTGRYPFQGADAEELHEQERKLEVQPPSRVVPELIPEVSEAIMAGLGRSKKPPMRVDEWAGLLSGWQSKELVRPLSTEEKARLIRMAGERREGSEKSFRRRMFWEKNWKLVLIIVAAVAVAGVVLGSILGNVFAPRSTHGFPPRKVVETFYRGMNDLDHAAMQACVIGKAGQGEINEATTLYVTSRVTMGYEGKSNIISAAEWDTAGRPALASPQTLYGVTGLTIVQEQAEPSPVFLVTYDKWNPAPSDDSTPISSANEKPKSEGHRISDRVSMRQDKGDWVIFAIERLSVDVLPPP